MLCSFIKYIKKKRIRIDSKKSILYYNWGIKQYKFGALGENIRFSNNCFWAHTENIYIESNVFINRENFFDAASKIYIKSGTMIGPRCTFIGGTHNYNSKELKSLPYDDVNLDRGIIIEKNVWIGAGVTVCPGTHIGEGAVIGAGTCVSGKVPSLSVVVSNGYKIIKKRDESLYVKLDEENALYNLMFVGRKFCNKEG